MERVCIKAPFTHRFIKGVENPEKIHSAKQHERNRNFTLIQELAKLSTNQQATGTDYDLFIKTIVYRREGQ